MKSLLGPSYACIQDIMNTKTTDIEEAQLLRSVMVGMAASGARRRKEAVTATPAQLEEANLNAVVGAINTLIQREVGVNPCTISAELDNTAFPLSTAAVLKIYTKHEDAIALRTGR